MALPAQESAKDQYALMVDQGTDPMAAQEIALRDWITLEDDPEGEAPDPMVQELGEQLQVDAFEKWLRETRLPNG